MPASNEYPERLRLRDTGINDDLGGLGQRIYTTAGAGYQKVEYVRADRITALEAEVARLREDAARLDYMASKTGETELYAALYPHYRIGGDIREAIDAAMRGDGGEG